MTSAGEREFPFPSIPKNESLWFPFPNYGNGFFHSLPVPEFRECFFFIPFPFPNYGNGFFSFPSRSRIVGMDFFHSLPVPELWEWIFLIPFPFPNLLFHRQESKRELDYCKRYQASNFFSFLYISQNNYIEEVNWDVKSEWLKTQDILLSFVANSFAAKVLVIVNKIILFWFLFINSGRYNNKNTGDNIKNGGGWGWECLGQNSFSRHIFAKYFSFIVMLSLFIPVPVPGYSWEW